MPLMRREMMDMDIDVGPLECKEIRTICYVNQDMAKIPEEVWMFMLMFVDDVDLLPLSRTCRFLNRLTKDAHLWRSIHRRNKLNLHTLINLPQRSTREHLAAMNVMRGRCLDRKLSEGQYVGGAAAVRAYESFMRLQKEGTRKAVMKGLEERPGVAQMSQKNLMPAETTINGGSCSPRLVPKVVNLKKAMTLDSLKKQLRTRISVEGFKESGVAKTHTVTAYNPSIHSKAVELDKRLCEIHLVSKLVRRPSAGILESMKLLPTSPETAVLICPPIKSKLDFYEGLHSATTVAESPGRMDGMEEEVTSATTFVESPLEAPWMESESMRRTSRGRSPLIFSFEAADVVV
ncbi:hypothetical protein BC829DRAFT_380717 [Chytridium lagenaria]|nr:hypothetical protein BC829DRAFT_380717 [Chytridium lagenaria]